MTPWQAVRLVAGREIRTRLRSKAFRITTILFAAILVVLAVVFALIAGGSSADKVGLTPANAALSAPLRASGKTIGQAVDTPRVPDEATGREQVRDGDLDALLVGNGSQLHVVVKKNLDKTLGNVLNVLARQVALDEQISGLGGNPAQVQAEVSAAKVQVEPLRQPYPYNTQQLVLGIIAGVLIYLALMINGQIVAQGVVEEKSSRVVEMLLATIRPWQLMAGKVLGIGLVGLIQMVVIGVIGLIAGLSLNVLSIPVAAAAGTLIWLVVWYLLGFFMYALAFAAAGALVSRQEDAAGVVMPILMFVIAGYVLGISILPSDPGSTLIEVLSIIPAFAPTLMPMRLAMGGVPIWEAGLSILLVLAMIPLLTWFGGRIYRNAVLR
ncbi:MAG: ABC transporter permease, partial [Sciscionella sp.]